MAASSSSISGAFFHPPNLSAADSDFVVDEVKAPDSEPQKEKRKAKSQSKLMLALKGKIRPDGLTKSQEKRLRKHAEKYSSEHAAFMRVELAAGKTWSAAHAAAMEHAGPRLQG